MCAIGQQGRGIGSRLSGRSGGAGGVSDDRRDGQLLCEADQFPFVSVDELGPLDQVERQISAQAELGKHGQIGAALLGALRKFQNLGGISGEVADGGIELRERDLHKRPIEYGAWPRIATSCERSGQFAGCAKKKMGLCENSRRPI